MQWEFRIDILQNKLDTVHIKMIQYINTALLTKEKHDKNSTTWWSNSGKKE
jgi:hypothetical protein